MKFLFFLLAVVAMTCYVGAQIQDCGSNTGCMCEGIDNLNKILITCSGASNSIYLYNRGITSMNADAFDNNTNMTEL